MTFLTPETDFEQDARIRAAFVTLDRLLCDRLFAATRPGTYERAFLLRDPSTFDPTDRAFLKRLAWHYRTRLPAHLRPKVNPADPIACERELLDG
jgi:hypothetical protein